MEETVRRAHKFLPINIRLNLRNATVQRPKTRLQRAAKVPCVNILPPVKTVKIPAISAAD